MKKAEEMTTAKNYREALNLLGQAKAHANEAQLKGIEEKIQAVDKEMNKGSLFDLMEQQPQPEQQPVVQNRTQPQPQQVMQPQPAYAPARQAPASRQPQRQAPMRQPERPEFGQPPVQQTQQTGLWPIQQPEQQPVRQPLQPHPHYASQIRERDRICMERIRQREDGRMNPSHRRMNSSSLTSPILNNRPTIRKTTKIT